LPQGGRLAPLLLSFARNETSIDVQCTEKRPPSTATLAQKSLTLFPPHSTGPFAPLPAYVNQRYAETAKIAYLAYVITYDAGGTSVGTGEPERVLP
jgi:hypothetical protein